MSGPTESETCAIFQGKVPVAPTYPIRVVVATTTDHTADYLKTAEYIL